MGEQVTAEPSLTPGYWTRETTGILRPAVERYLNREPMTPQDVAAMRAYFRQWMRGEWRGEAATQLRALVDGIETSADIAGWLALAETQGIDPL